VEGIMKTNANIPKLSNLIGILTERTIIQEVNRVFSYSYPDNQFANIHRNYLLIKSLYEGNFLGYRACNTEYHSFMHTMDALLAVIRLIDGHNINTSPLPVNLTKNILNATLLHDTGYIQEEWDTEGTGAKYTSIHTERSIQFLEKNYQSFQINENDVKAIANMIKAAGPEAKAGKITCDSTEETLGGCMLGTASLISQMSDRAYLEKLIFLYYEFREAGMEGFETEFDILKKTVDFYKMMKKQLTSTYMNTYADVIYHFEKRFKIDHNLYLEAINNQIAYLQEIIKDDTSNFRHKLKRREWIHADRH
jgi:hypothetical protein